MALETYPNFESFGNYILLKRLATGGMAEVFLARPASHKGNGRVQVIKRILPHAANDSEFIKMFNTEIQVCMGFNHPHTVQIHDFGEFRRQPYISMEYIEGKNLKDIIVKFTEKGELMPIPMAISLLMQAAAGLGYAHSFVNKVTGEEVRAIHRDVSPHNLIVTYEGNLKVIDFGIAKAASGIHDATRAGTIKGKFAYLSPEQIAGTPLDNRVDIFALGIVAWEMLTLRRPFYRTGDSEMTILATISNCDYNVKAPSYYNGSIPIELDNVILKALRRDPNERYKTAEEFQAALRQVMQMHYPHYSYSENAKMMQTLFEKDIAQERNELRLLNMNVQLSLSDSAIQTENESATLVLDSTGSGAPRFATPPESNMKSIPAAEVDQRLRGLEKMMREKASTRHYILFAFYILSIVFLKLDESYGFFDFLLPQSRAAVTSQAQQPRAAVSQEGAGPINKTAAQRRNSAATRAATKAQQQYQKQLQQYQEAQARYQKAQAAAAARKPASVGPSQQTAPGTRRILVNQDRE